MTINEFIRKFRKAAAKGRRKAFVDAGTNLRIRSGKCIDCPITLVARTITRRRFDATTFSGTFAAAESIGLSDRAAHSIVNAADHTEDRWLRRRLLAAAGV